MNVHLETNKLALYLLNHCLLDCIDVALPIVLVKACSPMNEGMLSIVAVMKIDYIDGAAETANRRRRPRNPGRRNAAS